MGSSNIRKDTNTLNPKCVPLTAVVTRSSRGEIFEMQAGKI